MITQYPPMGNSGANPIYVQLDGDQVDAFGRLRISQPYTLFDSQARYAKDTAYSYYTSGTGGNSYNTNKSSVNLSVGTGVGTSIAQTYRVFPYQPGKSLLTMQTFTMASARTNLNQKIGYFNDNNGVFFMQSGSTLSFTIRTYTGGSVSDANTVTQANWNGDKLDGTGPSGITLDVTKTQILFFDFEWLGVGTVRCGFIINGVYINCHTFNNANSTQTTVYMQTAILPLRYEINATGTVTDTPVLQQICSTVISEGGYEQISQDYTARQTTAVSLGTSGTFYPLVSIRLNSSYLGAVVIPMGSQFVPVSGTATYEIVLVKNASLTGATWASTLSGGQVDVDIAATAFGTQPSGDAIVEHFYATASNQGTSIATSPAGYNWDLQLGVAYGATSSDTYTLGVRGIFSASPTCLGAINFFNLTV